MVLKGVEGTNCLGCDWHGELGKELLYEVLGGEKVRGWVNGAGLG
jgi:hypothetical protein